MIFRPTQQKEKTHQNVENVIWYRYDTRVGYDATFIIYVKN